MRPIFTSVVFVAAISLAMGAAPPKPLSIQNVVLSQYEDGPPLAGSSYFVSGETVFLSFQVSGYRSAGEDEQSIKLTWKMEAKDPKGIPIVEPGGGNVATTLAQEDKAWMPKLRQTILIPPFAPSGTYRIGIWLKDEVANAEVRKEAEFQVRGYDLDPADSLTIAGVHFYRGEEDKEPLPVAAYRPGDTVWIRFNITGFKLGEQNRFETGYGITVLRPNGETTFQQPEAAVERDQSFYPRRHVPGALSLTLPKDVMPGQYTVVLSANDKVGSQVAEARQTFTVEK